MCTAIVVTRVLPKHSNSNWRQWRIVGNPEAIQKRASRKVAGLVTTSRLVGTNRCVRITASSARFCLSVMRCGLHRF